MKHKIWNWLKLSALTLSKPPRSQCNFVSILTLRSLKCGFAVSSVDVDPWGNGGHLGDYDAE